MFCFLAPFSLVVCWYYSNLCSLNPRRGTTAMNPHHPGRHSLVYSQSGGVADAIIKGRAQAQRHYDLDPHSIIFSLGMADVEWLTRANTHLALSLEGFLGHIDCRYVPSKWTIMLWQLPLKMPSLFSLNLFLVLFMFLLMEVGRFCIRSL